MEHSITLIVNNDKEIVLDNISRGRSISLDDLFDDTMMANNIRVASEKDPHGNRISVDASEAGKLTIRINSPSHLINGETYHITFSVVPFRKSLREYLESVPKKTYSEKFKVETELTNSLKRFYDLYKSNSLDMRGWRPFTWSFAQQVNYIESFFRGIKTDTTIRPIIHTYRDLNANGKNYRHEVIDGKQRLQTVFDFLDDKFAVQGLHFSELCNKDQAYLRSLTVSYAEILSENEVDRLSDKTLVRLAFEANLPKILTRNEL